MHVGVLTTLFAAAAGQWKKVAYYFKLKKQLKPVVVVLCATCSSLEIAVAHLAVTDPSGILTTEKQKNQVDKNGKP